MEISAETLDRIADRFTDLAAHIHALQAILVEKGVMTEKGYAKVLDIWRDIVANQPSERAWKEALRAHQDEGKRLASSSLSGITYSIANYGICCV